MVYLILIVTLAGIVLSADMLVSGSVGIARRLKISDFVIGAVIVGIGTSMPELTVSFMGALEGNADVAIGNIVGSNIFNILGILGITSLLFPLAVNKDSIRFEIPFCVGISVLLTLLAYNFFYKPYPVISRLDGIILMFTFVVFLWVSVGRGRIESYSEEELVPKKHPKLWISITKTVLGLIILILSCDYFVKSAIYIARDFGVDDGFISITLIACGTSLPEFAASITAALKKNPDLSLGNIIGSNIFNIGLILGVSSQVTPLISPEINIIDYLVCIFAAILPLILGIKGTLSRLSGAFMLLCFILYVIYLWRVQIAI